MHPRDAGRITSYNVCYTKLLRIPEDSPAGKYLIGHGVAKKDFNSYGSRRGNHEVMMRGTFANIRLRNNFV